MLYLVGRVVNFSVVNLGTKNDQGWFNYQMDRHRDGAEYMLTLKIHPCCCDAPKIMKFLW